MMNKFTSFALLLIFFQFIESQTEENSDIFLEFDETSIKSLKLTLKWGFKPESNRKATKYVLFYEVGRLNVLNNFTIEYTLPELLDDEEVVRASIMKRENFKNRAEFNYLTSYNCSLYCLNSTNLLTRNSFECNLYSYDPSLRKCVLYEYDYTKQSKKKMNKRFDDYEIYDFFMDECDMDEFFSEFSGYSRMCRRIMDYREEHSVIIRPFIDFRFSISIRDSDKNWTPFIRKEFQYSPSISVDIIGDLKFGNTVKLKCRTDLSKDIVESITWRTGSTNDTLTIPQFSPYNLHQAYFCEIRIGSKQMIQKAFKFNISELDQNLKAILKLSQKISPQDLTVRLNWTLEPPENTKFKTEKILLLYSENGQNYKFLKNLFPFQMSKWESANFPFNKDNKFFNASSEEECAILCIQTSFCNHFVYKLQMEPYAYEKYQYNCRLSSKTTDGYFPCPKFSSCQNLKSPENYIQNNEVKISILPNITYRFKIQLRDKYLNWTDALETEPIFIPLKFNVEKVGNPTLADNSNFSLKCTSNINRVNKIIWTFNDVDIPSTNKLYSLSENNQSQYLNSVLEFNNKNVSNISLYNGVYKCKIVRDSDVSGFIAFYSEPVNVFLKLNESLSYNKSISNITLPTLPGLYLRLDCQVSGTSIESLNWQIDGEVLNEKYRFYDFEDIFVLTSKVNDNIPSVNRTLVLKLEEAKKLKRFECILNQNITVRSHFIEIVDERPELDFIIDKSDLNRLKLSIHLAVKKPLKTYGDLDIKPLKLSILYAENATLNGALQTFIAPETLSKADDSNFNQKNFQNSIGHLLKTQHSIQSCKLSCFQTAFCKAYEYLMYDDSCNFYSNEEIESFYDTIVDKIKQKNPDSNLIHLRDDAPKTVEEDLIYNFTVLVDKKTYSTCENRTANSFSEELYCRDELADFKDTYILENLTPMTSYQFKIEISNAFGISKPYTTELIEVPFKLNPIVQNEAGDETKLYKLECSTNLLVTDKLKFNWYKNRVLINKKDQDFIQNDITDSTMFRSELILHGDVSMYTGHYTCELIYESANNRLSTNTSYLFIQKIEPDYPKFENVLSTKKVGDMLTENCSASGWPLPDIYWYFNNKPVQPKDQSENENPHASVHHRNFTVMSYLYIFNLRRQHEGVYSCMLNGTTPIKNVTLFLKDINDKDLPNPDSKSVPNQNESEKKSNSLVGVLIGLFVLVAVGAIVGAVFFIRKKQSNTNALLSYNRIEEELMTGVDNINLTDDTQ